MRWISDFIVKKSKWIIITVILLTIFFSYWATKIKINSDVVSYLPNNDPAVKIFKKSGEIFGSNHLIIIALKSKKGIFNYETLQKIKKITDEISEIDGVAHITSLTKILDIKESNDGIEVSDLIGDEIPSNKDKLEKLKNYVLSKDMYKDKIVSADGKATVIIVSVSDEDGVNRTVVAKKVKKIVNREKGELEVYFSGMPMWMSAINDIIIHDMVKLVPFVIIVVGFILFLGFRSIKSVILILLTVAISSIWTIGLMSLFNIDMTMVSDVLPVILIAVGSAYGIHFINKYFEERRKNKNLSKIAIIKESINKETLPITLAALTTFAGFLSYITADLILIKEFGIFTAIGVLIALLLSIIFIPAVLIHIKLGKNKKNFSFKSLKEKKYIYSKKVTSFILKNERLIIIIFSILFGVSLVLAFQVKREVNLEKYFPESGTVRKASNFIKNKFGGSVNIQLMVESENIKNPFVLKQMIYVERFLDSFKKNSNGESIADLICEMNKIIDGYYWVPDSEEKIANLWILIEGQDILSQMVNEDEDKALIQTTCSELDTETITKFPSIINNFLKRNINIPYIRINIKNVTKEKERNILVYRINRIFKIINFDLKDENIYKKFNFSKSKEYIKNIYLKNNFINLPLIKKKELINKMYNYVLNEIPEKYLSENLKKRIRGDLYELMDNTVYIPISIAKKLNIKGEKIKIKIQESGMIPVYKKIDDNLLLSQFESLIFAFVIVFLLIAFQLKSFSGGLIATIPILITVAFNFGIMRLLHITLNTATIMIGGVIIGIGIDYTIHFLSRFKVEIKESENIFEALENTLHTTGIGILINALSVGFGFLVLIFATLIPLKHFGILTFLTMIISAIAAMTVLPSIIIVTRAKFIGGFERFLNKKGLKKIKNIAKNKLSKFKK